MSWTQTVCETCWGAYSYGAHAEIREPYRSVDPEEESCCFCNESTLSGIHLRVDPTVVPFPKLEKREDDE